jgi:hypothetical protein
MLVGMPVVKVSPVSQQTPVFPRFFDLRIDLQIGWQIAWHGV